MIKKWGAPNESVYIKHSTIHEIGLANAQTTAELKLTIALPSYLIHFTKLSDRLIPALAALETIGLLPEVVSSFDGDKLSDWSSPENYVQIEAWKSRIHRVLPILLANIDSLAGKSFDSRYSIYSSLGTKLPVPTWAMPRNLSRGEKSVLMKHFYALSSIANGSCEYGLIAEDDILINRNSISMVDLIFTKIQSLRADYIDLAGGCGLQPSNSNPVGILALMQPPRTRTNACYIVSRELALRIVDRFFPLAFPIDWHLQFIMLDLSVDKCYWAVDPPFIHGSEVGFVKSWRLSN